MVKVGKFIFDIGNRKVELTEDECMELKNKLNELFGQPMAPYYPAPPINPPPIDIQPYRPMPIWYETQIIS